MDTTIICSIFLIVYNITADLDLEFQFNTFSQHENFMFGNIVIK